MSLVPIVRRLADAVDTLRFEPPVTHVYNPARYAAAPLHEYLRRYGAGGCEILMVGMNPGPFGMAQTGVPFGDTGMVRGWLGISGEVGRPPQEHSSRPVLGFACPRGEVSGRRLWGWARSRYGTPEQFFARFFVWNYCPLCFLEESGRNRTPDKLPRSEREALFAVCDAALRAMAGALSPRLVLGIGRFAEARCREALAGEAYAFGAVPHPSPANPRSNQGWDRLADAALEMTGDRLRD